jgi:C1A family cysteine protease
MNKTTTATPKLKNECAKTRPKGKPYEVWRAGSWTWNVLKKWQAPDKEAANPYARWFCDVVTPMCPHGEMGDVYIHEIKQAGAVKIG